MSQHTQHANVRAITREMNQRRPTPVLDVLLATAIGIGLACAIFFNI